jgi:hypothetical protein
VLEAVKQLAITVLQSMGLINDHTSPFNFTKLGTVRQNHLKSGDQGIKLVCTWDKAPLLMKAVKSGKA